jgi:hypothetical protein
MIPLHYIPLYHSSCRKLETQSKRKLYLEKYI